MKKLFSLLLLILITLKAYSNPFEYRYLEVSVDPDNNFFFTDNTGYYFTFTHDSGNFGKYQSFTENDLTCLESGYHEIEFFGEKYYFVYGSGEAIMYFNKSRKIGPDQTIATTISLVPHIVEISESSYLTETFGGKKYEYKASNLIDIIPDDHFAAFWPRNPIPWVEGSEGSGIGDYIDITFDKDHDNMVILNGFVDFERTHLFKANNRVKKAKVSFLKNEIPYEMYVDFKDEVYFQTITFPVATSKIRFEIVDIYQGTKYDDTVISAILNIWSKEDAEKNDFRFYERSFERMKKIDNEAN